MRVAPRVVCNGIIEQFFDGRKLTKGQFLRSRRKLVVHLRADGVTVAKSIALKDKFETAAWLVSFKICLGSYESLHSLVHNVAHKTNEIAVDGTATAAVLVSAIYAVKNVAAVCNTMDLRRGAQAAVDLIVDSLYKNTNTITTSEIAQASAISTNGDTHARQLIVTAMVGKDSVIMVKEGPHD